MVTLAALVLFLLPSSPLSLTRVGATITPTATTPISSSQTTFYTVHAVPWGTLTVDGKDTVAMQNGSDYANITLAPGAHKVEYSAPPFPVIRCQVTVPNRGKDTCPTVQSPNDLPNLPDPNARVLDLRATVANLPTGELTALSAQVEAALKKLAGRAQLQAGDHYLDASGNVQVAATDMLALVSYELTTNAQQQAGCSAICDQQGMGASPNGPAWLVMADLEESWRYIEANGPVVAGPQLGPNGQSLYRMFAVTWKGSWQVANLDDNENLSCMSGTSTLTQDISSANSNYFQNTTIQQSSNSSNTGAADGCVMSIAPSYNGSGSPSGPSAYFLYRCGALIAVNPPAQAILPGAPTPSAHEQLIASQMIATISAQG